MLTVGLPLSSPLYYFSNEILVSYFGGAAELLAGKKVDMLPIK
jgi:hypothetical protein